MDTNKCPTCGWKISGNGWEDHACWCPVGWRALDRKLQALGIDPTKTRHDRALAAIDPTPTANPQQNDPDDWPEPGMEEETR